MLLKSSLFLKTLFSLMSIVLKMVRCAGRCIWMSHQISILVYTEFAWNYAGFTSNYYYFMIIAQLWKSRNYANKFQNYFSEGESTAEFQYGLTAGWGFLRQILFYLFHQSNNINSFIVVYIDIWHIVTVFYVLMCWKVHPSPWKVHFWPLKMYPLPQFLT